MDKKTLKYAEKHINSTDVDIKCFISEGSLVLEIPSGRNFELSEKEIKYQANCWLDSEKERIENL